MGLILKYYLHMDTYLKTNLYIYRIKAPLLAEMSQ